MSFAPERFLEAQAPVYDTVVRELRDGAKRTHWMWFIFPQLAGLGRSEMARRYALADLQAARDYLAHPTLGYRLRQCTALVNAANGRDAHAIFGSPDDLKLRSSLTLFALAGPGETVFRDALERYFSGQPDVRTLQLLR